MDNATAWVGVFAALAAVALASRLAWTVINQGHALHMLIEESAEWRADIIDALDEHRMDVSERLRELNRRAIRASRWPDEDAGFPRN